MRVIVAGASGAIGEPLIAELLKQGHSVVGITTSETGARTLEDRGATAAIVNALDRSAVEETLRQIQADAVIDQLTSLPKELSEMPQYAAADRTLRIEGGGNLLRAAMATGVRRYLQQSSGFFLTTRDSGLADETSPLDTGATPGVAASARTYTELEQRLFACPGIEGVALRYGFFYGPRTWYFQGGSAAKMVLQQQIPLVGKGQGVSSFVHIHDAAIATVTALTAGAGVYNVVDDHPLPQHAWLPAFADFLGAPAPPHMSEAEAKAVAGDDTVYYATRLHGASNAKAKRILGWKPRKLEWLRDE